MGEIEEFSKMRDGNTYKFFINGKWQNSNSGKTVPVYNPFNNELIGNVQACTKEEVDAVVQCAHDNIYCWEPIPIRKRAQILRRIAEIMVDWSEPLGHILMQEIGKPIKGATRRSPFAYAS